MSTVGVENDAGVLPKTGRSWAKTGRCRWGQSWGVAECYVSRKSLHPPPSGETHGGHDLIWWWGVGGSNSELIDDRRFID